MFDIEEFIEHHGVKGQKWGVRKPRGDRSAFRKRAAAGPNPKHLSDDELKKRIDRMRLERQFSDLSKPQVHSGKAFAKRQLENSGNMAVGAVVSTVVGIAIKKAFKSK